MTDTTLAPTDAEIEELLISCGMRWAERSFWLLEDADLHPAIRTAIAKWGAPAPASGEVVVTCAPDGRCVAVTRQDDEGRILSVIWVEPTQDEPILRTAAQSLIDRWDTPLWKDAEHTGAFIQRLREALAAPPAQDVYKNSPAIDTSQKHVDSVDMPQEARVPLSDEQIDRGIAELGLNYLADAYVTNRSVLRKLCRHVYGITAAQKETP